MKGFQTIKWESCVNFLDNMCSQSFTDQDPHPFVNMINAQYLKLIISDIREGLEIFQSDSNSGALLSSFSLPGAGTGRGRQRKE